jgi:hypothetical protein
LRKRSKSWSDTAGASGAGVGRRGASCPSTVVHRGQNDDCKLCLMTLCWKVTSPSWKPENENITRAAAGASACRRSGDEARSAKHPRYRTGGNHSPNSDGRAEAEVFTGLSGSVASNSLRLAMATTPMQLLFRVWVGFSPAELPDQLLLIVQPALSLR